MRLGLVAPCMALIIGLLPSTLEAKGEISLDHDQTAVAIIVFRALFEHNASAEMPNKRGAVLCLFDDKDPDSSFLYHFGSSVPPAYPCSAMATRGQMHEAILAESGQPAIEFWIKSIDFNSQGFAKVVAGYYEASVSGAQYTFLLYYMGGKWAVISRKMDWIS